MILDKPVWKTQDLDDMHCFPSSPCQKRTAITVVLGHSVQLQCLLKPTSKHFQHLVSDRWMEAEEQHKTRWHLTEMKCRVNDETKAAPKWNKELF